MDVCVCGCTGITHADQLVQKYSTTYSQRENKLKQALFSPPFPLTLNRSDSHLGSESKQFSAPSMSELSHCTQ